MDKLSVDERLFRKIPDNPNMFKAGGEITSAVFKDTLGCSVDRQGRRKVSEVHLGFIERFGEIDKSIKAIADVSNQDCKNVEAVVYEKPEEDNPFHCEIHSDEQKVTLTKSQARHLARVANVITIDKIMLKPAED